MELDPGFRNRDLAATNYSEKARASLEWSVFDRKASKIVKSPFLCDELEAVVASGIHVAHIFIPMREFSAAAMSRQRIQLETTGAADGPPVVGGLWGTEQSADQDDQFMLGTTSRSRFEEAFCAISRPVHSDF